ncbi:MAG: hypothetical protein ABWY55_12645 [Microbacterium sp.]
MKRGAVIGLVAGAVAVAIAGAGVAWWALSRPATAEQAADAYLRALSQGDFGAVSGMLAHEPDDLDRIEAAFTGASGYVSDYTFDVGSDHSVRADAELDGRPVVVHFVLEEQDGGWRVGGDYLVPLEATTTIGDSVRVGGALAPAATPVPLLPALYLVTAAPSALLVGETEAVVAGDPVTVAVEASVSPDAIGVAQEQLDAYAQACAAPAATVPSSCGIRVPWAADLGALTSIAFRIDQLPVLALSADGRTFAATDGVLVATATGTTRDGAPGSFTYRADDWALRGGVAFTGDEMVLTVG